MSKDGRRNSLIQSATMKLRVAVSRHFDWLLDLEMAARDHWIQALVGLSILFQTVYSYDPQPTILLLLGSKSNIDLSIAAYGAISGCILAVQVSSIAKAYKLVDYNSQNEISNSIFDEEEGIKSSIYRHLYRLQVYLLEPFFTGYLLSLILSSNKLNENGV